MKIYIQTDIEGVAGFCFFEQLGNKNLDNFAHIQRMRKLLTNEVNAAVTAAFDSGASEVLVNDSHGSGYNILFEELDPRCRIIHGRNCSGSHWLPLLETCDRLVLVGMHAMGGTAKAVTSHSKWELNGGEIYLSEASMAAAIAGDFGIPCCFASGDQYICAELREKMPALVTVETKQALSPYQACSLIPKRSCELIYQGVKDALQRDAGTPFVIKGPVKLDLLDNAEHIPPFVPTGNAVTAPTINEAFMAFERNMAWTHFDQDFVDGFQFPN